MNWYLDVLRKYAVFSGRARRKEYWFFILFNLIASFIFGVIDGIVGVAMHNDNFSLFGTLYALAVLIPAIAVGVRRLHDTGRTGWWILIGLIPLIGWIVLLIFMVQDSQPGANVYGSSPKEAAA
ncbi:DUF805 domain-containing protein [Acidihalobacter ferrooxydans]|uniref:DUF805 domain-containing protein n=1 Tax=Acidihalobacter ferrooxydans TaxID=1765967 RepID=A0A1P8UKV0_9GAMM|nr:DUF805 domain-containing protein [Acidihalobacter ferrooxydans]APZ44412.1 hypothetical protein BW247_16025 [Acidihalobacter ferrooxydans]